MEPTVAEFPRQPYAGVAGTVTMQTIGAVADRIPELLGWLATRGIAPAGPPFLRYRRIEMADTLDIEAGVPVAAPGDGDGEVFFAELPAGRYATVVHTGPFTGLVQATADLLSWAAGGGLRWDETEGPAGEVWGCRLEIFHSNPAEAPDPETWETELRFRLADRP